MSFHEVTLTLHSHQRQALYYMLKRERGWDLDGEADDVWKAVQDGPTSSTR